MRGALALLLAASATGCDATGGRADEWAEARGLVREHGCGSCHMIPTVPVSGGVTGPPLEHMADQAYVAGVAANTPEALARFIFDPQAVDPRSAMPRLDITMEEAKALADFLYAVTTEPER